MASSTEVFLSRLVNDVTDLQEEVRAVKLRTIHAPLNAGRTVLATINAGVITAVRPHISLIPQTGTTDDLATINNGFDGKMIALSLADGGDTITIKHETGNISLSNGVDYALDDLGVVVLLMYKETTLMWEQVGFADPPSGGIPAAHASSHQHGGSDEVATATPAANAIPKADGSGKLDSWITPIWVEKAGDTMSGNLDMGTNFIVNLADPLNAQDGATKAYVDAVLQGLDIKASVRAATTANITLSGPQTIDGVSVIAGDRVLVKNQSAGAENGIYVVAAGAWSRSIDANTSAEVTAGMYAFVSEGTTLADSGWVLTTNDPITLGTTALVFTQFSGAGQIIDGPGLTKSGNTLSVNVDDSTIEISVDTLQVKNLGITYAKIQNVSASDRILGRVSASAGVIEEIVFTDQAQQLADDTSFTAMRTTLGLGTMAVEAATDYVTIATTQTITGAKTFSRAGSTVIERTGGDASTLQASLQLKTTTALAMVDGFGPGLLGLAEDNSAVSNPAGILGWVRAGADNSYVLNIYQYQAGVADLIVNTTATEWQSLLTGFVVGDGTGAPFVAIDGAAGQARSVAWRTAAVNRWILAASATAESGSNAGSDLQLLSRTDAGGTLRTDLTITRSNGNWTFGGSLQSPTIVTPTIASFVNATHNHQDAAGGGQLDHGLAMIGLLDDDHTQYALLAGRAGGQTLNGGTASGNNIVIDSTAHATKGHVILQPSGGAIGIGTNSPVLGIHLAAANANTGVIMERTGTFAGTDTVGIFQARYAGDSLAQMVVARDGANDAASLSFQTQPAGGSLTDRFGAKSNGRFYIGNGITPQGYLHIHDGTGGNLFVTKTGIAGTDVVLIPNGAGDATLGMFITGFSVGSGGQYFMWNDLVLPGGSAAQTSGANGFRIRLNVDGSVDCARTSGTQTYSLVLEILWI